MKKNIYFVKGMHCASCEILIERKMLEIDNIKSVNVSLVRREISFEYKNKKPSIENLNKIFKENNYIFSDKPTKNNTDTKIKEIIILTGIAILIIGGFIKLNNLGLAEFVNVNANSSLFSFFFFGLLAGVSTCAALVGGIMLSMSKQWMEEQKEKNFLKPHIMFNIGRIISYAFLGAILGAVGKIFKLSLTLSSILVIAVSVIMIFLSFQMIGFKTFSKIRIAMPNFIARYIRNEKKLKGQYMPFIIGALTFFLPCGFTITSQGLALLSGSALRGGLIMLFFALGTMPSLLAIGFSSAKFLSNHHVSEKFLKIAGILVLFFALYNINSQLNVLGAPSLNDLNLKNNLQSLSTNNNQETQTIKMIASADGYEPDYFIIKAGVTTRWEIEAKNISGCTNAIIAPKIFNDQIDLTPNQTTIKEFIIKNPGRYKFSCWMGMVSGIIEVVK